MDLDFEVLNALVAIVDLLLELVVFCLMHWGSLFVNVNLNFKQILDLVKTGSDILFLFLEKA